MFIKYSVASSSFPADLTTLDELFRQSPHSDRKDLPVPGDPVRPSLTGPASSGGSVARAGGTEDFAGDIDLMVLTDDPAEAAATVIRVTRLRHEWSSVAEAGSVASPIDGTYDVSGVRSPGSV